MSASKDPSNFRDSFERVYLPVHHDHPHHREIPILNLERQAQLVAIATQIKAKKGQPEPGDEAGATEYKASIER